MSDKPMEILLEVRHHIPALQRSQLHAAMGQLVLDMRHERIGNDDLTCCFGMIVLLVLTISTAPRITTDGVGRCGKVEDVANLCWGVGMVE